VADRLAKSLKEVRDMDGARNNRLYEAGDTVELEITLHHSANLREVRSDPNPLARGNTPYSPKYLEGVFYEVGKRGCLVSQVSW
jgi:hypothetical protein